MRPEARCLSVGYHGSVVDERAKGMPHGQGYNAETGEYCDLIDAGVVDSVKVTHSALQNAASIGAMLLTTEVLLASFKPRAEGGMVERQAALAAPMGPTGCERPGAAGR